MVGIDTTVPDFLILVTNMTDKRVGFERSIVGKVFLNDDPMIQG